jgi:hypothetical protein
MTISSPSRRKYRERDGAKRNRQVILFFEDTGRKMRGSRTKM